VFAVRASIAYKGAWVRRTRTFAKEAAARQTIADVDAWFAQVLASIAPGRSLAEQVAAAIKRLPNADPKSWMAESCLGTYPLQAIAGAHTPGTAVPTDGDHLVLSLDLTIGGTPWLGAAPVVIGA
jgi:hypothetical protein